MLLEPGRVGNRVEDHLRELRQVRPHLVPGGEVGLPNYLDAVVGDREGDAESALAPLSAGQICGQLVDRDLEVLDVVDREGESRRQACCHEPDNLYVTRRGRDVDRDGFHSVSLRE